MFLQHPMFLFHGLEFGLAPDDVLRQCIVDLDSHHGDGFMFLVILLHIMVHAMKKKNVGDAKHMFSTKLVAMKNAIALCVGNFHPQNNPT